MEKTYVCANCNKTCVSNWTDEEALAESRSNFGEVNKEALSEICDDCYQEFMKWFNALPESERQELESHKNEVVR